MAAAHVGMGELALTQSTSTVVLVTMDTRAPIVILVGRLQIVFLATTMMLSYYEYSQIFHIILLDYLYLFPITSIVIYIILLRI